MLDLVVDSRWSPRAAAEMRSESDAIVAARRLIQTFHSID
jgi:hypothetical protein